MTPLALDASALVQLLLVGLVAVLWGQINGRLKTLERLSAGNRGRLIRIETRLGIDNGEDDGDLAGG